MLQKVLRGTRGLGGSRVGWGGGRWKDSWFKRMGLSLEPGRFYRKFIASKAFWWLSSDGEKQWEGITGLCWKLPRCTLQLVHTDLKFFSLSERQKNNISLQNGLQKQLTIFSTLYNTVKKKKITQEQPFDWMLEYIGPLLVSAFLQRVIRTNAFYRHIRLQV